MKTSFRERIEQGEPILFDGALGTQLYERGVFINRSFEEINLSQPQLVFAIHRDYLDAGTQVLTTNSWGANASKLQKHNLHDKTKQINQQAVSLAREARGDREDVFLIGSVGPLGSMIEPLGSLTRPEASAIYAEQMTALIEAGCQGISLETFSRLPELLLAIETLKKVDPSAFCVAQFVIETDDLMTQDPQIKTVFDELCRTEVDVVGLNCSAGPSSMLAIFRTLKSSLNKPFIVRPNAGLPKIVDGRRIYLSTPEYFATYAKNFLQAGIQCIGGCCGTTPEHIKAVRNVLRFAKSIQRGMKYPLAASTPVKPTETDNHRPLPLREKSAWSRKIVDGEFVSSIELLPPFGVDVTKILERSRKIKETGVDAINIPDGPRASARMSAILTAVMIEQQVGIETVLHYTCRDRNLVGMQADMFGAQATGLRNLLIITGDPPKLGSYPDATGVFDVDSIGLTHMIRRLNEGFDLAGQKTSGQTTLSLGVGVNPANQDFHNEMTRFEEKIKAGAEWAITQPVFDIDALWKFLDYMEKNQIHLPIIAGIWPLVSHRNALFMQNEVPGISIPEKIMERMARAKTPESAKQTGVEIAQEMSVKLGRKIQGIQVSAPFGRIDLAMSVLTSI